MDGFPSPTSTVPKPAPERGRSTRLGQRDGRRPTAAGAAVAAHPYVGTAASGPIADRRSPGGRDVFARSAAGRLAVSGTGAGGGADRRPAAEAAETPGHPAAGGDCGPGVWAAPRRLRALDHSA